MTDHVAGRVYLSMVMNQEGSTLRFGKTEPVDCAAWVIVPGQIAGRATADFTIPAPRPRIARGRVNLAANGTGTVTFSTPFAQKPIVLLQREGNVGIVFEAVVTGWTQANGQYTGFTVGATRVGLVSALLTLVSNAGFSGTSIAWAALAAD